MSVPVTTFRLDRAIGHWAHTTPERVAVRSGSACYSYRALYRLSHHIRNTILVSLDGRPAKLGIGTDEHHIAIAAMCACLELGIGYVVLAPSWAPEIVADVLAQGHIVHVLTDQDVRGRLPPHVTVVQVRDDPGADDALGAAHNMSRLTDFECYLLTSGSSGAPKLVEKSAHSIMSECVAWLIELEVSRQSDLLLAQSLHYSGCWFFCMATMLAGGSVTFVSSRPTEALVQGIRAHQGTHLFLLPSQLRRILHEIGWAELLAALPRLQVWLSLGERLGAHEKLHLSQCDFRLIEMWGNTEGLGSIWNGAEGRPLASVGRSFIFDELFVEYPIGKTPSGYEVGAIGVITDATSDGDGGKILSSDQGYLVDSSLFLIGRMEEVVRNRSGLIVEPHDLYAVIETLLPGLSTAFVCDDGEHSLFVETGNMAADLGHLRDEIVLRFLEDLDTVVRPIFRREFERTSSGKIDRARLFSDGM